MNVEGICTIEDNNDIEFSANVEGKCIKSDPHPLYIAGLTYQTRT